MKRGCRKAQDVFTLHAGTFIRCTAGSGFLHGCREKEPHQGRCKCGAVKSLKFKWMEEAIPYPSFFWGCVKYTVSDRSLHDSASTR